MKKFLFTQNFTINWYSVINKVNCLIGRHDWCRTVKSVTLKDNGRYCINCHIKQEKIAGEWRNVN
jgi:hypothetical protein